MGLARPAGWPGGHGHCGQASTELHKAPLLRRAQLPWAAAGGRQRNAPSQERGGGGHLYQVPPAGPETPMACTPGPHARGPRGPSRLLPQQPSPGTPREVQKKRAAAPSSSGVFQPQGLSPLLGQTG